MAPELLTAALLCLATTPTVRANGRLPGATALAINPTDGNQLLLGLTYGLAHSRDRGASWSWMCEQQIEGNGSDVDPSIAVTSNGTLVAVSLTNGGVLVSGDDGCSFERAMGPLQGNHGVDLTLDASQPGHVLALMSTIEEVVEAGYPRLRNLLAHSLDHGHSWEVLAELPDDMFAETIEVAPSDPDRIYVSGVASADPLMGIVERSDDGGQTWTRYTAQLPRGSGSLFISGIHPNDPDRIWFRVPGRGDIYGVLPARLWLSTDGAQSFAKLAETEGGMLGFAVSPDGERIAFGGPLDGLFLAPADRSAAATKVSDLRVSCLRWHASGLYVCAGEPADPYGLGFAAEPTEGFSPLWHSADTCRAACAAPSPIEALCEAPWQEIALFVGAQEPVCGGGPVMPDLPMDAGTADGNRDGDDDDDGDRARDTDVDASATSRLPDEAAHRHSGGCAVASMPGPAAATGGFLWPATMTMWWLSRRPWRAPRLRSRARSERREAHARLDAHGHPAIGMKRVTVKTSV